MDTVIIIGPIAPYRGGIARHTACVAQALSNRYRVEYISFKRLYPALLYPGTSDRIGPLPTANAQQFKLDLLNPLTWWQVARDITQQRPSAVIIPWWTTVWALPIGLISRQLERSQIPVIGLIHNVLPHEAKPWDRWLTRFGLRATQRFIVQSQSQAQRVTALFPNAAVAHCAHPPYPKLAETVVQRTTSVPQLLFFGLVRDYKGLTDLLHALAIIQAQALEFQLNIIGEFWTDIAPYETLITTLGLDKNVAIQAEFVSDAAAHVAFETADLVIAPYRRGTQSGVLALAQQYGKAIIASTTIRDSVQATYPGWQRYVPPQQPAELAVALADFLTEMPPTITPPAPDWSGFQHAVAALLDA